MSVNKAIIIGNLGQEVELRYTQSGIAVATISVATTDKRKDKDGNVTENTEWHRINVWQKLAENCAKFLTKGSKVYVEGKLGTREWEKDGIKRYSTEITAFTVEFLDPKGGNEQGDPQPKQAGGQQAGYQPGVNDDEIPF